MNAIALLVVVAGGAVGQYCGPEGCATLPTTRLVSVEVMAGDGIGSGTIVRSTRERSLVLTAYHMVRGRERRRLLVRALDGQLYGGRFLGRAEGADLAALEITTPMVIRQRILREYPAFGSGRTWELEIAREVPSRILMYGWGGENGRGLTVKPGTLLRAIADMQGEATYSMRPELGDSGGGAWSRDGFFVGVLSARDGYRQDTSTRAYIVGPDAIRRFLAQECCLLRALGQMAFGRSERGRLSALNLRTTEREQVFQDRPVSSRIIGPPPEAEPMVAEEEQQPARRQPRDVPDNSLPDTPPDRPRVMQIDPDLGVLPVPITKSVVVFQDNAGADVGDLRARLAALEAKMKLGITFVVPQLNGLQRRRTVRLGETIGQETNIQGPAGEALPTTAPNQ